MASLRNAVKRRIHSERPQPRKRQKLGLLEHHVDYTQRARAYNAKKTALKRLEEKAAMRNPDEFYFSMQKTQLKGGVHRIEQVNKKLSADELALLKSQDANYVAVKLSQERAKVAKLQASLHLVAEAGGADGAARGRKRRRGEVSGGHSGENAEDGLDDMFGTDWDDFSGGGDEGATDGEWVEPRAAPAGALDDAALAAFKHRHIVFCDNDDEARTFDAAAFLETAPELLSRTANRPRVATLAHTPIAAPTDTQSRKEAAREAAEAYDELAQRMERVERLTNVAETLTLHKQLNNKGRKHKVAEAADGRPPVYKWKRERKR